MAYKIKRCPYCEGITRENYTFCIYCAKRLKGQNSKIDSAIKKAGSVEEFIKEKQISMF